MGHHHHNHNHDHHHSGEDGLSLAFWLNLIFSVIESIGGIMTNSTAILADAFHDFMDAVAIGIAVIIEKISGRRRSPGFSYGYKRFSLMASLGMAIFLLVGSLVMATGAIRSFIAPAEVDGAGMIWLALLGLAVNGFAFLRIKSGNGHNQNKKAIMLHLLEDVLGWAAVLVGAIVISFTGWFWVDGLLALAIAVFIGYNAIRNMTETLRILLQAVPHDVDMDRLTKELMSIRGVSNIHDLHAWSLDGEHHVGTLHAVVKAEYLMDRDSVRSAIDELMKTHRIPYSTVQIEGLSNCCILQG